MPNAWEPTPAWNRTFRQALAASFDEPSLNLLTADYFSPARRFVNLAPAGPGRTLEVRIQELLDQARMEDWLLDLLAAAYERRPRNAQLVAIAEERGLTLTGPRLDNPAGTPLEALIQTEAKLINLAVFNEQLPVLEGQICFVDVPQGGGTGFLVDKNLVLTNQHVVAPIMNEDVSWQDVRCRFDYKQAVNGSLLDKKGWTEVGLDATKWLVDSRPPSESDKGPVLGEATANEVDYALIRLAEAVGELPIGGDTVDPEAQPRGWITPPTPVPPMARGNQVFLVQHPQREPLQLAIGTVEGFNASGTRVRHTANSKHGSSGSPCLNADLQLVALHHAHDPAYPPQWNQAVPFGLIQQVWKFE
jgi:Trypsin-like peptidase domain/Effector-associated domain 1